MASYRARRVDGEEGRKTRGGKKDEWDGPAAALLAARRASDGQLRRRRRPGEKTVGLGVRAGGAATRGQGRTSVPVVQFSSVQASDERNHSGNCENAGTMLSS